jgi:phospholipase D1/2
LIGMLPGLALMSFLGDRIMSVFSDPSAGEIGILVLAVLAYIGLAFGAQALLSRRGGRRS